MTSSEIQLIQNEIEIYTKQIEHEKINLSLATERHDKQLNTLKSLQGRPVVNKEQKIKENQKKRSKRTINDLAKPIDHSNVKKEDIINNDIMKKSSSLENLNDETNLLQLENIEMRKKIEELRKEKVNFTMMLNSLNNQIERQSATLQMLKDRNEFIEENPKGSINLKSVDLASIKDIARKEMKMFQNERNLLEENYQKIIEESISREREHIKEVLNKKTLKSIGKNENAKLEEDENVKDRTPILDLLIEKVKYFNVEKKKLLDRYQKNSIVLKDSLDQMMEFLGIENYDGIPFVMEKIEDQMCSIELLSSKLNDDIEKLEKKKAEYEHKIANLQVQNEKIIDKKSNFTGVKHFKIDNLKRRIEYLNSSIKSKRNFFSSLKNPTDEFLLQMESMFVSEYIHSKVSINRDVDYNETNVVDFISNIEDYNDFIDEINKPKEIEDIVNFKDFNKLSFDSDTKIENLKKENIPSSLFKTDVRSSGLSFDEIIKARAEEIINKVNQLSEVNDKKKKK